MNAWRLGPEDAALVGAAAAAYPFKPYRNFRMFSRAAESRVLAAALTETLAAPDAVAMAAGHREAPAVAICRRLGWDSAFFGMPMARVEALFGGDGEAADRGAALDACLDACRQEGIVHVAARVDAADTGAVATLESRGFRLMDGLVTYIWRPGRDTADGRVRDRGRIRPFKPGDEDALLAIATAAYRGFKGRFHMDPQIPDERADAFYVEWARQCLAGAMADVVLVSEGAGGALLGFLAFRKREPVSSLTGTPVFGGGLGACRPDAPGAYAGLIRAGTRWAHAQGGVAECQTQISNFPTVRIYEAVGARYVGADYTLHASLRQPPPSLDAGF